MPATLMFSGAARNVTGSRYLLQANNTRFFVDCGMYQERHFLYRNWEAFPVDPTGVEAVLVTHAHLDHCGRLPRLVALGFRGRILATPATADIAQIILQDAAKLQEEDAAYKKKRHLREGRQGPYPDEPLYTMDDVEMTLPLFETVEYDTPVSIGPGIEVTFRDAGHVLGSSTIRVHIKEGDQARTTVFSGDLGRWNRPMLEDPEPLVAPDYIVMESTYGDRTHGDPHAIPDELAEIINSTVEAGGHIIIPSFALQRAQEILYCLNMLLIKGRIKPIDVYLDSPMAIRVTDVFKRYQNLFDEEMKDLLQEHHSPFDFPGLKMTQTTAESKELNFLKKSSIIIAGSGMVTGGRIKHHIANNISRPESTILFVGYQADNTLGRHIVNGAQTVRIHGISHPVRARIAQIGGFSAHADRDDLLRWLSSLRKPPRRVFITHGEEKSALEFEKYLKEKTGYATLVPHYQETVMLE
jgi:metallo-beta-lactamase family protein